MSANEVKLLPCPFCGSEAKQATECENGKGWVFCSNCGACSRIAQHIDHAIAYWNNRTLPAPVSEGWADISTAPRDGTSILVVGGTYYSDGGGAGSDFDFELKEPTISNWFRDGWHIGYGEAYNDEKWAEPTHWRPLPAPPAVKQSTKEEL